MRTAERINLRRDLELWTLNDIDAPAKLRELKERVVVHLDLETCQVDCDHNDLLGLYSILLDYMDDDAEDD